MSIKTVDLTSIEARRFSKRDEKIRNVRIDNNSTVTSRIQYLFPLTNFTFNFHILLFSLIEELWNHFV